GYIAWSLVQPQAHAATRLVVHELAADDDHAWRALLGAVGAMRDQVHEVEIEVDLNDSIDRALVDPDRARFGDADVEHAIRPIVAGPLVRVTDPERALGARGIHTPWRIDPSGAVTLLGVTIAREALGAVLFGGLALDAACRVGWARADDGAALARAQS